MMGRISIPVCARAARCLFPLCPWQRRAARSGRPRRWAATWAGGRLGPAGMRARLAPPSLVHFECTYVEPCLSSSSSKLPSNDLKSSPLTTRHLHPAAAAAAPAAAPAGSCCARVSPPAAITDAVLSKQTPGVVRDDQNDCVSPPGMMMQKVPSASQPG
jgi:uncharacterized membrane protein